MMQWVGTAVKAAFLLIIAVNFYRSFNFSYCYDWKYIADAKRSFNALQRHGARNALVFSYRGTWINYYSIAYKKKYKFMPTFYQRDVPLIGTPGFRDTLQLYDHAVFFPPYEWEKLHTPQVGIRVLESFMTGATIVEIQKNK
jgi:hypothetical protein